MVYSNTAVYGENKYGKSGPLSIFTSLKHLMMLLDRASYLHLIKDTDSIYTQLKSFDVEALLNKAFKLLIYNMKIMLIYIWLP